MPEPEPSLELRVPIRDRVPRAKHERHAVLALRAMVSAVAAFCLTVYAWIAAALTLLPLAWRRGPLGRRPTARQGDAIAEPNPPEAMRL